MYITPYSGAPYQRGHGIGAVFKGILRYAIPFAKSGLAKSVLKTGVRAGASIAADAFRGRNMKEAVKHRVKDAVLATVVESLKRKTAPKKKAKKPPPKKKMSPSKAAKIAKARRQIFKGTRTPSRGRRDIFD